MSPRRECLVPLLMGCLLALPGFHAHAQAQYPRGYVRAEELVTISPEMAFAEAIKDILNPMAKHFEGKPIIDRSGFVGSIGVPGIMNVHWKKALEVILSHNNLKLETYDDYYEIVGAEVAFEEEIAAKEDITLDSREVRISAVFFEAERSALYDLGIDWSFTKGTVAEQFGINWGFTSGKRVAEYGGVEDIEAEGVVDVDFQGGTTAIRAAKQIASKMNIAGLLRAIQTNQKGEVIANPQITVVDGQQGRIQIGQSISILTKDEAGNVLPLMIDAGIILTIKPRIITEEDIDFIYVDLSAEHSEAAGTATGGVSKSTTIAQTSALLQDGDETIVGGLYMDKEKKTRTGIPFLKDLPWWVFGIKFLTGYNNVTVTKEELIVVLRASIVPSIRERIEMRKASLSDARERDRQKFEQMKSDLRE